MVVRQGPSAQETFLDPAHAVAAAGINEGMEVADFGCGSGFFAQAAARAVGPHGRLWAIDADRGLLARLASTARAGGLNNLHIITGDVERHGGSMLPDESMDFVMATNVLFSARHKDALAEEIWRVLKNTRAGSLSGPGRALIIDWKDRAKGAGPEKEQLFTEEEARSLFESSGFEIMRSIPAGSHHWGFVIRKKVAQTGRGILQT